MITALFGGVQVLSEVISHWTLNIGVAVIALYVSGYFLGKRLDHNINTKKGSPILNGSIGLFLILLIGIISGATVGFIQEGVEHIARNGRLSDALFDYYTKPLYWIVLFGFIPTLIAGVILGYSIKKDVP